MQQLPRPSSGGTLRSPHGSPNRARSCLRVVSRYKTHHPLPCPASGSHRVRCWPRRRRRQGRAAASPPQRRPPAAESRAAVAAGPACLRTCSHPDVRHATGDSDRRGVVGCVRSGCHAQPPCTGSGSGSARPSGGEVWEGRREKSRFIQCCCCVKREFETNEVCHQGRGVSIVYASDFF